MRQLFTAAALVAAVAVGGCDTINGFDPLDKISDLDIMGSSKTPLKGERRAVFQEGVPGVPQGVPPDLVKGYQPPPEAPPPVVEAKPVKQPRPKKVASAPRRPPPPPRAQRQPQEMQQAPVAQQQQGRTTTQPVGQSAGQMQQMPGSQPAWPSNAPPAPGPWTGPPQR